MVLDKQGIKDILVTNQEQVKRMVEEKNACIFITSRDENFNPDSQIGNDSIDLRIGDSGYILSDDYEYINTLSDEDFSKYYIPVQLDPNKGYNLKPGALLFIDTLEQIHLDGNVIGRVTGRSVFSRFGLSVHCTQDKFSSGINSIVALEIVNNSNTTLKIYPYQKLAQMLIERTSNMGHPYSGTFSNEKHFTIPKIKQQDREQYIGVTRENILQNKPRKKPFYSRKSQLSSTNSIIQSIISCICTVAIGIISGLMGSSQSKTIAIISLVFFGIFFIANSVYSYWIAKISMKDSNYEENS